MALFSNLTKYIGAMHGDVQLRAVSPEEVAEAERILGFAFPGQLRQFYQEIGFGWFGGPKATTLNNMFLHPLDVATLYVGTSEFYPVKGFVPGDLPILDCGWNTWLVMRPFSDNPNAVYLDAGEDDPVASSLVAFVEKMLEDPGFYL